MGLLRMPAMDNILLRCVHFFSLSLPMTAFAILGIVVSDKLEERLPPPALPARGELAAGNTELLHDEPERDARGR